VKTKGYANMALSENQDADPRGSPASRFETSTVSQAASRFNSKRENGSSTSGGAMVSGGKAGGGPRSARAG
jgi:hypothetical protein